MAKTAVKASGVLEAHAEINASKLLTGSKLEVYNALFELVSATSEEVAERLKGAASPHKRLPELEKLGVVARSKSDDGRQQKRLCRVTKTKAQVWEVAGRLPNFSGIATSVPTLARPAPLLGLPEKPSPKKLAEAVDNLWRAGLACLAVADMQSVRVRLRKKGFSTGDLAFGLSLRETIAWLRSEAGETPKTNVVLLPGSSSERKQQEG